MKKVINIFLSLVLMASFVVPNTVFAAHPSEEENNFDYDYAYNWALEVGFSEGFLKGISEEALKRVYFDNIGADELDIEESVSIVSLDDPIDGAVSTRGNIHESIMEFRSSAVKHTSGGKVARVQIYFTAQWLNGRPLNRYTDGIIVNWDSSLWYCNTNSFWGKVEDNSADNLVYSSNRPAESRQGGLGWYAPLTSIPLGYTPTIRIGFELRPRNTNMPSGSSKISTVDAIYGHRYVVPGGISISASGVSVTMSGFQDRAAKNCLIGHG
mgnify:FL=1